MVIPDLNVLVYVYNASAPRHLLAVRWWEDQINGGASIGICWPVLQGFVRLLTGRQIVTDPYSPEEVFSLIDGWLAFPSVRLLGTTPQTYLNFRKLVQRYRISGSMTTDALIAALVLEHGAVLASNDTDFLRFREIRVLDPLST